MMGVPTFLPIGILAQTNEVAQDRACVRRKEQVYSSDPLVGSAVDHFSILC
jgi:uncharacterized Fe-S center protein